MKPVPYSHDVDRSSSLASRLLAHALVTFAPLIVAGDVESPTSQPWYADVERFVACSSTVR